MTATPVSAPVPSQVFAPVPASAPSSLVTQGVQGVQDAQDVQDCGLAALDSAAQLMLRVTGQLDTQLRALHPGTRHGTGPRTHPAPSCSAPASPR